MAWKGRNSILHVALFKPSDDSMSSSQTVMLWTLDPPKLTEFQPHGATSKSQGAEIQATSTDARSPTFSKVPKADGQSWADARGHHWQRGPRAKQTSWPNAINLRVTTSRTTPGMKVSNFRRVCSGVLSVPHVQPKRFAMRCTCVSTTMPHSSTSPPKTTARTKFAIFGPTPGNFTSAAKSLGT
eukprot:CAMPEP_0177270766 /NCGR_PEP_ID=MMETSP0367-20130122/65145_1 /TAXON_ID=447022 ORGANISM="Scrippsiella hangoei-like, Strain SHHI-4" /NCGR_SAMPLE_ID=MMETSP0367 /ASSEMBLY_ACC=CAM_ASM_000362 /LENGTH=183 /DNA_ID=CAMNT_0018726729 /DNA_START=13 /DNA_END=564 /DNA_ORIENTATION=-